MADSKIELGDVVQWASQAQGVWKTKEGTVVKIVPKGDRPQSADGVSGCGWGRDHESYIVEVHHPTRKPTRYWPLVSKLTVLRKGSQ